MKQLRTALVLLIVGGVLTTIDLFWAFWWSTVVTFGTATFPNAVTTARPLLGQTAQGFQWTSGYCADAKMTDVLPPLGQILPFSPRPKASRSGGPLRSSFLGHSSRWPTAFCPTPRSPGATFGSGRASAPCCSCSAIT